MKLLTFCAIPMLFLIACSKNNNDDPSNTISGRYAGTFKRYNTSIDKTARVSIDFNKEYWSGSSELATYPALNTGTFSLANNNETISFKNKAGWTADFDWTFILDGNFILHKNNDSLVFTKSYGNGAVDVYKLAKEK
ncbi:hypothetical protein [Flavihumibacter cheonanensis]|uniref:hypothetical protein n=1 Tax=Flavihumibacter cheonanensis TaxID=1442385 RepID=UPI001EF8A4F6|nr:hypothetical protein [Flavihumibacter cheonanensis]MCG7752552.1 hypothetical protein [Flavihumibacter cheonanensis]